ncbi:hypothetical protein [Streptomyces qinglanensis]|uniref:hypothetical protein n=1 Tax=Streptomyces qinglanensis TaxID=943816 RepID=UPI003D739F67
MPDIPSLSYSTVRNVDLSVLRKAVTEWGKLPKALETVTTTFGRTVSGPLETSGWMGETADAAFGKFRHVKSQMNEAEGQARNMGTVMTEALNAFEAAKEGLKQIEDEISTHEDGTKSYLKINPAQGVVYLDPPDGETSPGLQKAYHEVIASHNKNIREHLDNASRADHRLKIALQIDPAGKGFNDDIAGHLVDVDKETKEDIDTVLELAQEKGPGMSEKELSKFNGILAKNAKNADFAEQFTLRMGPKGTIDFWYDMAKPRTGGDGLGGPSRIPWSKSEAARRAALQDNLGVVLGLASRSASPAMETWKKDMLDISMDRIHAAEAKGPYDSKGVYNAQVLSNLMRTGKWDSDFLDEYGEKLLDKDREVASKYLQHVTSRKWISSRLFGEPFLNFGAEYDEGEDPLTGYMEALGHNAEASTEFFSDKEKFDYVLRDREWPQDGPSPETGRHKDWQGGNVALGHALASATTGHDWDAKLPMVPSHTQTQADIMSEFIKGIATNGNQDQHIELSDGMSDGLQYAASEYMPDIYRGLRNGGGEDLDAEGAQAALAAEAKLYPIPGAVADMEHRHATHLLYRLGQDPEAYGHLMQAQKRQAAEVLDHQFNPDVPAGEKYSPPAKTDATAGEVLATSGEITGTMSMARQEVMVGPAVIKDSEFEKNSLSARLWGNSTFGAGVTAATAYAKWFPNPVVGATLGALTAGYEGAVAYDIDRMITSSEGVKQAEIAAAVYDKDRTMNVNADTAMLQKIQERYGLKDTPVNALSTTGVREGFGLANYSVTRTASYLDSMKQVPALPH